jgi:hypothetical protein
MTGFLRLKVDCSVSSGARSVSRPDIGDTTGARASCAGEMMKAIQRLPLQIAARLIVSGLLLFSLGNTAEGQPLSESRNAPHNGVQPLDRLLPGIRLSHPGQLVDAHGPTISSSGDLAFHLKWITPDGNIIWLSVDAQTGQVLRISPGRDDFDRR